MDGRTAPPFFNEVCLFALTFKHLIKKRCNAVDAMPSVNHSPHNDDCPSRLREERKGYPTTTCTSIASKPPAPSRQKATSPLAMIAQARASPLAWSQSVADGTGWPVG